MNAAEQSSQAAQEAAHRTARGAAALLAARFAGTGAAVLSTAVLARHLAPSEFGLVAMVLPAIALGRAFEEIGLGDATVQREGITDEQISSLFWINVAAGVGLAALFAASAPLIALFYGDPAVVPIALALAPLFVIAALGAQHRAVLRRNFRFRHIALSQGISVATGAALGIASALAGLGAWSLVVQNLAAAATLCAGNWIGSGFRPSRPRLAPGLRPLVRFGAHQTATQFLTAITRNIDNILIGRALGPAVLGLYDRAFQLMMLPSSQLNHPLTGAVVPALSRLQHDPDAFRRLYRGATEVVACLAFPLAVFTAAAAPAIVETLLGREWRDAAPILRALAPCGLMLSLNVGTAWVYQSLGRNDRQLRWVIFGSCASVAAIVAGLPYGALGVALSLSATRVMLRPFGVMYCFRGTFLSPRDLLDASWRPALAAAAGGVAAWLLDPAALHPALRLAVQAAIFATVALAAIAVIPGGFRHIATSRAVVLSLRESSAGRGARSIRSRIEKPLQMRGILPTEHLRLPDFLGIGAQKAGTTWLAEQLRRHPGVFIAERAGADGPERKELHYFDDHFDRPLSWYASHFREAGARIAGEITPAYAVLPEERVAYAARALGRPKAIFLLRDPVERAWSQAVMTCGRNSRRDPLLVATDEYLAFVRTKSALARSSYLATIELWSRHLGEGKLHLAFHDDIRERPEELLAGIHAFLGVAPVAAGSAAREVVFAGPPVPMPDAVREELVRSLAPELRALADRFGGHAERWRARWNA